ncbi:MAG: galactokinase [Actinomycetota bacterium]|nr:galactokinase [Actinomycetota bacterium]
MAMNDAAGDARARAVAAHVSAWGPPQLVVRAPGRVNLIGEHTDYNDGFTLPMALPFDTVLAVRDTGDRDRGEVTVASEGFGEITIDPAGDPRTVEPWARHIAGVVSLLGGLGVASGGWSATVATDIPTGASLSSSAAIEVATITALVHRAGLRWSAVEVARLGQRVENEVVGLASGIMDQLISAGAVAGHASLMDCRSLELTPRPLPSGVVVAIMDTGTRRVLADVAYGERRASCERAAAALGVTALRDATLDQVVTIDDEVTLRRATHVVTENTRTLAAAEAMERGDAVALGRLMNESHASLRDDYEVSGPGLDAIVEVAQSSPGCLGARMTGGGFAGCAVALVTEDLAATFERTVRERYDYDGNEARIWLCEPSAGAGVLVP